MSKINWDNVANRLEILSRNPDYEAIQLLDDSQRASIAEIAKRIRNGCRMILIADEVGMGKTRIAAALIAAVVKENGRAAIVLPPGLGVQWQSELALFCDGKKPLLPLRSYGTFIEGFVQNQDKKTQKKILEDRRAQRELPAKGWSEEKILMISHNFARMIFRKTDNEKEGHQRKLLPLVRLFCGPADLERRIRNTRLTWREIGTYRAAKYIASTFSDKEKSKIRISKINYKNMNSEKYKNEILPLIGRALGDFDLIVIDEAHKSRGADSSLSKILGSILRASPSALRVGMTATPVELNAEQWINTIERIGSMQNGKLEDLQKTIDNYVEVVKRIQTETLDEDLVNNFESVAKEFKENLKPYVIRRDKRDDPIFEKYIDTYRKIEPCLVESTIIKDKTISKKWLRLMAAGEALSIIQGISENKKRYRIKLAQGMGLNDIEKFDPIEKISTEDSHNQDSIENENGPNKFWLNAINTKIDIYSHPSILKAVDIIEKYTSNNQKVLVFGVFLEPLKALTMLLDARAMLHTLGENSKRNIWPASKIPKGSESAVRAAIQMSHSIKLKEISDPISEINKLLEKQYKNIGISSDQLDKLINFINNSKNNSISFLKEYLIHTGYGRENLRLLLLALNEVNNRESNNNWEEENLINEFEKLINQLKEEASDQEDDNDNLNKINWSDAQSKNILIKTLQEYLENHTGNDGNFARLMEGKTNPQARRNMQASFNRPNSRLKVLVAQSQVGREGMNLQEACKTVILFHSEWNPGVVEQQIGRVDRKKSLWLKEINQWEKNDRIGDMPTINIHPIILAGTYGEHNWETLNARWKSLRAQLNGDILGNENQDIYENKQQLIARIKDVTPRFNPSPLSSLTKEK
jgi:superfamily II DNA or RNA helicase